MLSIVVHAGNSWLLVSSRCMPLTAVVSKKPSACTSVTLFPPHTTAPSCRSIPENRSTAGRLAEEILGSRTLGVRQVERMLPVGTVLTAVGELSTAVEHPSAFKVMI